MFVLLQNLSQLQTGSILKRSACKMLSEPGLYIIHSHNFFIRKFWIPSMLNNDRSCRNVCFKYIKKSKFRIGCSPLFKLNRIDQDNIFTPSLIIRNVICLPKRF